MKAETGNVDDATVDAFGVEWSRFDQSLLSDEERQEIFDQYFSLFPWRRVGPDAVGFDLGCGSGRWARLAAPRVRRLHCVDASPAALDVARRHLRDVPNCEFHLAQVDRMPFPDNSMDFGYSLGVLHHVPDTRAAIASSVRKLKPGAPFLAYLYYAFDNRPPWFRFLWRASDTVRRVVARLPAKVRICVADVIALSVYWPCARMALVLERLGLRAHLWPLSAYRRRSFYLMRTDALDRFGTRLEQRFTRTEIKEMLEAAGLTDVAFRESPPYWCAIGFKR